VTSSFDDWDASYRQAAPPPWDIGRPQPTFVRLAGDGRLAGELLDAGCGTGEHALLAASNGATALGVDLSRTAVAAAREKAAARGIRVTFEIGNILEMDLPEGGFDTIVDSGLFHVFDDHDRNGYVATLARALRTGGQLYLMCFSDAQPGDWGPRRVRKDELEDAFSEHWAIERIEASEFEINPMMGTTSAAAWLTEMRRQ
jgi:cyclopropane fatty-acyl-phospholipid synthase-like methyltransferase